MVVLTERPLWLGVLPEDAEPDGPFPNGIQYSARDWRQLIDAALDEGALGDAGLVTQRAAGANASVDINGGLIVVKGETAAEQGKYTQRIDDDLNFTDLPGTPSSGTRHHLLYVKTNDPQSGVGTIYQSEILIAQDTGGGRPATPANSMPLAEVRRVAGQPSVLDNDITDLRPLARNGVAGFFEFYGGNGQEVPRNSVRHYAPFGVRNVSGCTVANPRDARVTNLKPGLWWFSFTARVNGEAIAKGRSAAEIISGGTSGTRNIAGGSTVGVGTSTLHSSGPYLVRGGDIIAATLWQDVQATTNINDYKADCRFQGVLLGRIPGLR